MAQVFVSDYFYGDESKEFSYFRIPRLLITHQRFKNVSVEAKLLYGLLLDRMGLSEEHCWYDEDGRVFIYYTIEEIADDLCCGRDKAMKLLAELDKAKGAGLIERIRQGQGKPTKIYVKRFTTREVPPKKEEIPAPISEVEILDVQKSEIPTSRGRKPRLQEVGISDPSYHIIHSYARGEVTPEQAHDAGVEFARRLLGDKYEAAVCTHTDRDHLHCHIVFNSVSFMDGKKYRSDFKSYFHDLRGISNEVSRERGYSVIEPNGKGVSYSAWNAEKRDSGTIRDLIRRDIDAALAGSLTYDTFLETLRRHGYAIKRGPNVKHTAVRPPGGQRFVRLDSLGDGYTEADLMQRLSEQRHEPEPTLPVFSEQKRYTVRRRPCRYTPVKRGSFRALYLYYLYLLSPRKRKPQKIPFETRTEIRRAKQYRQQFFLLQKYHIDTKPELEMLSDALSNEMQILVDQRKELYALRREQPSEPLNADIDALTAQLRSLRRELRLCGKIAEYAPRMLRQVQESNAPSTENHLPNKAKERRHSLWR